MKKYLALILIVSLASCKAKKAIAVSNVTEKTTTEKIIEGYYNNKIDFSSLYIKANVKYKDSKQTQAVTAEIRIKKDTVIMVSIRFLGITMAKTLITPDKVKYYEKINSKFFEGNYAALTDFLGTELDFQKVQNLFIGRVMDDLKNQNYNNYLEDKMFKLESTGNNNTKKTFFFNEKYQLKKEIISQAQQNRILEINYPSFKEYPYGFLPETILIDATQEKGNTTLIFDYTNVSFNESLSFPYSVPEGYEQVFIK